MLKNAKKDQQTVKANGEVLRQPLDGVKIKELVNIVTANGITTEAHRNDWNLLSGNPAHMIHVQLNGNAISGWHCHEIQTDHIFVTNGSIKLVLYDGREASPSHQKLNIFHFSRMRPSVIIIPPGVWHGIQNLTAEACSFINYFDREYCYENPDEWRLPLDTDDIPYDF